MGGNLIWWVGTWYDGREPDMMGGSLAPQSWCTRLWYPSATALGSGSWPDCVSAPPVLLSVAFFLFVFSCGKSFWLIFWSFSALATVYVAVVLLGQWEEARLSQFPAHVIWWWNDLSTWLLPVCGLGASWGYSTMVPASGISNQRVWVCVGGLS